MICWEYTTRRENIPYSRVKIGECQIYPQKFILIRYNKQANNLEHNLRVGLIKNLVDVYITKGDITYLRIKRERHLDTFLFPLCCHCAVHFGSLNVTNRILQFYNQLSEPKLLNCLKSLNFFEISK